MAHIPAGSRRDLFAYRYGATPAAPDSSAGADTLDYLAGRRSCRRYLDRPVDPLLRETLAAAAFCAPTKSDLQQRDIVILRDPALRAEIDALFPNHPWIAAAPAFLVFCGHNRRQRQLHEWRGRPFANDHLDALFNAAVDAAVLPFVRRQRRAASASRAGLQSRQLPAHAGLTRVILGWSGSPAGAAIFWRCFDGFANSLISKSARSASRTTSGWSLGERERHLGHCRCKGQGTDALDMGERHDDLVVIVVGPDVAGDAALFTEIRYL